MKKTSYTFASFLLTGMLAAGCGTDENEQPILDTETDTIEEKARDLPNKIENTQNMLVRLNTQIDSSESNKEIQKTGESLEEHWGIMKEEIKEQYPDDFDVIEENMEPLIEETQKASPDFKKMKSWIEKSDASLTSLRDNATEPKKQEEG